MEVNSVENLLMYMYSLLNSFYFVQDKKLFYISLTDRI